MKLVIISLVLAFVSVALSLFSLWYAYRPRSKS